PGQPVAVTFHGPFPDGTPACINCGDVIPSVYADVNAACAVLCVDLNLGAGPEGFCDDPAHARASTNTSTTECIDNACTAEGTLRDDFVETRRALEPVRWTITPGTLATG